MRNAEKINAEDLPKLMPSNDISTFKQKHKTPPRLMQANKPMQYTKPISPSATPKRNLSQSQQIG